MGGAVGAAERSMANNASPVLIRFADQSELEAHVKELCDEMVEEDFELQEAMARGDRDGANIAKARIKRSATKKAYQERQRA
jgi:hypothetical protein